MDKELLKTWRNSLGIDQTTAARLLRLSPYRYGEMERGYNRSTKKETKISANIADSCLLILNQCEGYSYPSDLIVDLSKTDAIIAELAKDIASKNIFPEYRKEKSAIKAVSAILADIKPTKDSASIAVKYKYDKDSLQELRTKRTRNYYPEYEDNDDLDLG